MIISILTWAVIVAALLQKDSARRRAALCFIVPLMLSELSYFFIAGGEYYIYSGLIAMSIVLLLKFIGPLIYLTLALQVISIIAIILNMGGWILFTIKIRPSFYEYAFIALYTVVLYLLTFEKGKNCVGFPSNFGRSISIYRNARAFCRRVLNLKRRISCTHKQH